MSVPKYTDHGPLEITVHLNLDSLAGKSVIITGGVPHSGNTFMGMKFDWLFTNALPQEQVVLGKHILRRLQQLGYTSRPLTTCQRD